MSEKENVPVDADRAAEEMLKAQQREKQSAYEQSKVGQVEIVGKYRIWAVKEHEKCRDGIQSVVEYVDGKGQRQHIVRPGIPCDYPANALVKSNFRSRNRQLAKLREFIAVCDVMLARLRQSRQTLPENYQEAFDDLLADIPDENVMEVIQQPKK